MVLAMGKETRQDLVDQRAANAQTLQFVADRTAEMADAADEQARKGLGWAGVAAAARAHRKTLMEVATEEKRLATAIQLSDEPDGTMAAAERELRKDLLEVARAEGRLADELLARDAGEDPAAAVLAEQAERNQDLLRHVARTATTADRTLRRAESQP